MKVFRGLKEVGKFQWIVVFLFAIAVTPGNVGNVAILIIAPKLDHWCDVDNPEFQNLTQSEQKQLTKDWPRCKMPKFVGGLTNLTEFVSNTSTVWETCEKITFEENHIMHWTVTEKFGLFCDRQWLIQFGNTIYMLGYFTGAVFSGGLADRFGRKKVVLASGILGMFANILAAAAPVLEVYYLARFCVAIADIGTYTSGFILTMELLRKDHRVYVQGVAAPFFLVNAIMLAGLVTVIPNFEHICYLLAGLFAILVLVNMKVYPESPRWLTAQKRVKDAEKITHRIAEFNKQNPEDLKHLLFIEEYDQKGNMSFLGLFRTPLIRKRTLLLWCVWTNTILINYGLMFNLADFGTDIRQSMILSNLLNLPNLVLIIYLIKRFGRQVTTFVMTILAGVFCLCMTPFVEDKSSPWLLAFALTGMAFAGNQFFLVYQITPELYPTVMRTIGLGSASTVSRVGGMIAPLLSLLNVYWSPMLVVILGSTGLAVSLLVPFLPDTTGYELPQTVVEGERFQADHTYGLKLPPNSKFCGKTFEDGTESESSLEMDDVWDENISAAVLSESLSKND